MTKLPLARRVKNCFKTAFPASAARYLQIREHAQRVRERGRHLQGIFARIYDGNLWGHEESVSGPGSSLDETLAIRAELPALLRRLGVRTLLDAPCGDCYWIERIQLDLDRYIGIDIVPDLIAHNRQRLARQGVEFMLADITRDALPGADLVLCRDCLIHFSYHYIFSALRSFRHSGATWLLTTTYSGLRANRDILSGQWRPIDLELPPFSFSPPEILIHEKEYEQDGQQLRRGLGLWRLAPAGTASSPLRFGTSRS